MSIGSRRLGIYLNSPCKIGSALTNVGVLTNACFGTIDDHTVLHDCTIDWNILNVNKCFAPWSIKISNCTKGNQVVGDNGE